MTDDTLRREIEREMSIAWRDSDESDPFDASVAVCEKMVREKQAMIELLEGEVKAVETRSGMTNALEQQKAQMDSERDAAVRAERERWAGERALDGAFCMTMTGTHAIRKSPTEPPREERCGTCGGTGIHPDSFGERPCPDCRPRKEADDG